MVTGTRARSYEEMVDALAEGLRREGGPHDHVVVRGEDQGHQGQPDVVLHQRALGRLLRRRDPRPAVLM